MLELGSSKVVVAREIWLFVRKKANCFVIRTVLNLLLPLILSLKLLGSPKFQVLRIFLILFSLVDQAQGGLGMVVLALEAQSCPRCGLRYWVLDMSEAQFCCNALARYVFLLGVFQNGGIWVSDRWFFEKLCQLPRLPNLKLCPSVCSYKVWSRLDKIIFTAANLGGRSLGQTLRVLFHISMSWLLIDKCGNSLSVHF